MELKEALEHAHVIIVEEEKRPTLGYFSRLQDWPERVKAQNTLPALRKQRPRDVLRDPDLWELRSTNSDVILELFRQLSVEDREKFLGALLNATRQRSIRVVPEVAGVFLWWEGHTSALPLIAEVCVRNGYLDLLLKVLSHVEMPNAAIVLMMFQLEETISLNFNVFSQAQLKEMPAALKHLWEIADRQTWSSRGGTRSQPAETNKHFRQGFMAEGTDVAKAVVRFLKQCEQAHYWYVLGALQRKPNLEIESDKAKVESFLAKLGFDANMTGALNEAENNYKLDASAFELKNCLVHLRSFLEYLHRETAKTVAAVSGDTVKERWGDATDYLRKKGFFSKQHEDFVTSLYTLISDESVHPLGTGQEYARLLRNMVIEYGVMFLSVLDKNGIRITR